MSAYRSPEHAGGRLEIGNLGRYGKCTLAVIAGNMVKYLAGRKNGLSLDPLVRVCYCSVLYVIIE